MIEAFSDPGDRVLDPFAGSGTTIIATEMTGRRCVGIEISPAYVDVCVRRWEGFTGRSAILESSGDTFAETAQARDTIDTAAGA
jgi:DNA modification methylase